MVLKKSDLHKINIGDVFYHINPLSCGYAEDVRISKIKVSSIEYVGFWFWKKANNIYFRETLYETVYRTHNVYVNDLFSKDIKYTTDCLTEATEYLKSVNEGTYQSITTSFHSKISLRV